MRNKSSFKDQRGIVSIVVTFILMLVITVIVLSFAKISRREQRNALDRQLSTQAFYAAESGVNAAAAKLSTLPDSSPIFTTDYLDDCSAFATDPLIVLPINSPLPGSAGASYTCMFVDVSPKQIIYSASNEQHILPIKNKNPAIAVGTVEIYWDNGAATQNFSACAAIRTNPTLATCTAPVLRVELVDGSAATLTTSKVFFIYPSNSAGGTISFGASNGQDAQAPCGTATAGYYRCRIQITGLSSLSGYYMRVKGIYDTAAIQIEAGGGTVELVGAQAIIDVTGKAVDVLRRLQVRAPINNLSSKAPLYVLEGNDEVCKKFTIDGSTAVDQGSCWAGGVPD